LKESVLVICSTLIYFKLTLLLLFPTPQSDQ